MIAAPISHASRYAAIHPDFEKAFAFLHETDLPNLPDGRHEIDGDRVFAIAAHDLGRGQAGAKLEFHRRYIDIQYVVGGFDLMGWLDLAECRKPAGSFDEDRDLGFFEDAPVTWARIAAGSFAVFFPEDAHAPLGTSSPVHKVVIKIAV